ncbi:UNVERIFIED_CONTAM: hypothetical protein FKN15_067154 [Acipenser sinensis]
MEKAMQSIGHNLGFVLKLDPADQLTTLCQSERQSKTGPELQNRFKNAALLWTVVSDKLLALASEAHRSERRQHLPVTLKRTAPSAGLLWYLLVSWTVHLYLEHHSVMEQNTLGLNALSLALLALSSVAMALFTASFFLRLAWASDRDRGLMGRLHQLMAAQQYPLQGLAALLLLLNSLFLNASSVGVYSNTTATTHNHTMWSTSSEGNNRSAGLTSLPVFPEPSSLTSILSHLNYFLPMMLSSLEGAEPVWKQQKAVGFLFSLFLVLTSCEYTACHLEFRVLYFTPRLSSSSILERPGYVLALYFGTLFFTYVFCLCIHMFLYQKYQTGPARTQASQESPVFTRRPRKRSFALFPVLALAPLLACKLPLLVELLALVTRSPETPILLLWVYQLGHCLLCSALACLTCLWQRRCVCISQVGLGRGNAGSSLSGSFIFKPSEKLEALGKVESTCLFMWLTENKQNPRL